MLDPSRSAGSQISPGSHGFENRCCRIPNQPQTPRKAIPLTDKPPRRVRSKLSILRHHSSAHKTNCRHPRLSADFTSTLVSVVLSLVQTRRKKKERAKPSGIAFTKQPVLETLGPWPAQPLGANYRLCGYSDLDRGTDINFQVQNHPAASWHKSSTFHRGTTVRQPFEPTGVKV